MNRSIVAGTTEAAMGGSSGYDPVNNTQRAPKLSLVAQLLLRSQGKVQPVPKRGRGRPRKLTPQDVQVAARVWSEVTDGAGVLLYDGKPVEVPEALK